MGDGNNITHSWIRLAARLKLDIVCACPEGFEPDMATVDLANASGAGKVSISHDVMEVSPCNCGDGVLLSLFSSSTLHLCQSQAWANAVIMPRWHAQVCVA